MLLLLQMLRLMLLLVMVPMVLQMLILLLLLLMPSGILWSAGAGAPNQPSQDPRRRRSL